MVNILDAQKALDYSKKRLCNRLSRLLSTRQSQGLFDPLTMPEIQEIAQRIFGKEIFLFLDLEEIMQKVNNSDKMVYRGVDEDAQNHHGFLDTPHQALYNKKHYLCVFCEHCYNNSHPLCRDCHYTENWTPRQGQCYNCHDALMSNTGFRVPAFLFTTEVESYFLKPLCKDCLELSS